ncbi:SDR family oxidoreductase [Alkalilimnicola sp. S0819]|uniref:SDR family oxidoreductase n=1 Tax=Alkalilimnicola sp. S0819 TaxID=2613922 RepID=UPI001261603E|nr:SDR family oxidoreductase [Alkalilimnicola sp. S0819]KAB7627448.1 SDR family oxidoreductase [Alkalilimnicola sp. S0819]MPQ15597.1 SDR family NAD(P)-dependent oxidoreductase [Alkalilimnicola sp. S0819]
MSERIALISGGNRGLGLETARQLARHGLRVVITSREGLAGKAAADKLQSEGLRVNYLPLDLNRPGSAAKLAEELALQHRRLDVLVNNAGLFPEGSPDKPQHSSLLEMEPGTLRETLEVNLFGAIELCQRLLPLMRRNGYGRIVNVSSQLGQLAHMRDGFPAYRISKTGLNAVTRMLAAELQGENILVNSVSPGWVRTRMGGPNAPRTPAEAAQGIVWAATLADDGPSGGFFENGQRLEW